MSISMESPQQPCDAGRAAADTATGAHGLDNPTWAALTGPQRHLGEVAGGAARYQPDVSRFVALADPADPGGWNDLAALVGPGAEVALAGVPHAPAGWEEEWSAEGVQLVAGPSLRAKADPEAVRLTAADVPEMLDLVARTRPGPFAVRTIELGAYYGVRRGGRLVAMAGERLKLDGWTEISAVCTDADHRGQGLGGRLVLHTAAGILDRGETPFLHAAASNTNAIRLYEAIGFTLRRPTFFRGLRVPAARTADVTDAGASTATATATATTTTTATADE